MSYDFDCIIDRRDSDCAKWHYYAPDVLPLWVADMDFRSPQPVIDALRARVEHGIFGYGGEPAGLREAIVEWLRVRFDWSVLPEDLLFVPGVVKGFFLAVQVFGLPGQGVLVQPPVYKPILMAPGIAGMTCDEAELTRAPDGRYGIDFERMEQAVTERTRMFLLCSPHNPVGRVFTRRELEQMAELCLRHDMLICSDEIHADLVYAGHPHTPIAALDPEVAARTITLMAPSKTFNIAGLEFSFAVIQNRALRERYAAAGRGVVGGINLMGFVAAQAAYAAGGPWLDELLRYLEGNRDYLVEYVAQRLPGVQMAAPEGTFLAWLDCRQAGIPGEPADFFVEKARVGMNEGPWFGRGGAGFVRLNFACPRAILQEALERMRCALERLPAGR